MDDEVEMQRRCFCAVCVSSYDVAVHRVKLLEAWRAAEKAQGDGNTEGLQARKSCHNHPLAVLVLIVVVQYRPDSKK